MRRIRVSALMAGILVASTVVAGGAGPSMAHPSGPSSVDALTPRKSMGLTTNPHGGVVLFGGIGTGSQGINAVFGDTWVFATVWRERHPTSAPPPRWAMEMAYDAARGQTLLYGGTDGYTTFSDTWTWDGVTWTEQHPANDPGPNCCQQMAYDEATHEVVLFTGGETWTWDGTNWTEEDPPRSPPARAGAGMAGSRNHVILNGGALCFEVCDYHRDTWLWNGVTWAKARVLGPGYRSGAAMAKNVDTNLSVLFGGYNGVFGGYQDPGAVGYLGDTWVWNGIAWALQHPATSPGPRSGGRLAYNPTYGDLILFGGEGPAGYLADTWSWDGTRWSCVQGCS